MYICICMYIYKCIYVYIHIYVYIQMNICMYIYIYIYTHALNSGFIRLYFLISMGHITLLHRESISSP